MRCLAGLVLAVLVLLPTGPALAQGKPEAPGRPASGGRGGVGVTLDLGAVFRLLAAGATAAEPSETHLPGRIALVAEAPPDAPTLGRLLPEGTRERARYALDALEAVLIDIDTAPGAEATAIDALGRALPGAIVDRVAALDPQQASPARLYALAAIRLPSLAPGRRPALGVIDAAPTRDLPLAGTLTVERLDGDAEGHAHADAVLCLLACRPEPGTGFRGLLPDPELTLIAILERTGGDRLRGSTIGLARALDRLLARRLPVANVSLGGAGDRVQRWVVERAIARGLVIVAAAGNAGPEAPPVHPAAWPGVIAVAAHDAADRAYARGNRGEYITLAAPGVEVWLPLDGGRYLSGTSFAAPHVAARLAWATANGERPTIEALCARTRDLGAPGRDPVFGCGGLVW